MYGAHLTSLARAPITSFAKKSDSKCLFHYLIAPALVEAAIAPRTRAIIAVHLYGQLADRQSALKGCVFLPLPITEAFAREIISRHNRSTGA
jgi:hypothetical protein